MRGQQLVKDNFLRSFIKPEIVLGILQQVFRDIFSSETFKLVKEHYLGIGDLISLKVLRSFWDGVLAKWNSFGLCRKFLEDRFDLVADQQSLTCVVLCIQEQGLRFVQILWQFVTCKLLIRSKNKVYPWSLILDLVNTFWNCWTEY